MRAKRLDLADAVLARPSATGSFIPCGCRNSRAGFGERRSGKASVCGAFPIGASLDQFHRATNMCRDRHYSDCANRLYITYKGREPAGS